MADYESALEAIWRDLRQHLEWAEGFLLVLLYTRHPAPARELLRRAESLLQTRGLEPLLLRPRDAAQAHAIVQTVIAARPAPGGERPAIWLDLWDRSSDAEWQAQRYEILARLNERRFLLEQKVGRPLVLILPEEDRARMHVLAPDLWTVRAYSVGLPVPEMEERVSNLPKLTAKIRMTYIGPVEAEWRRLVESVPVAERVDRLDPVDGIAAIVAALDRGDIESARTYASTALPLARLRLDRLPQDIGRQRVLSGVLDAVGRTHHIAGELEAARAAYEESLVLRRQMRVALGRTLQVRRDLFTSLINVGQVSRDLGDLEAARATYEESLALFGQLRATLDDITPQALNDLSISLDNKGQVASDLGDLETARAAFKESLALRRVLHAALGDAPQVLRDLSASLDNVGRVSRDLGDLEAARVASEESLSLNRQLRAAQGDTPGVLEGLARALGLWGQLQAYLADPSAARAGFQEGADLAARLVALQPDHPGYRELQVQLQAELDKLESA